MSKYEELVELSKNASVVVATYQRESKQFVETVTNIWSDYLEVEVNLVSNESDDKFAVNAWDSMTLNEETGYWHFAISVRLGPTDGRLSIPLLFKKVNDIFQLKIANDANNKTFLIKSVDAESFAEFCDYLFESLKSFFRNFSIPGERKQVYGFTANTTD